jgi:hypothetical protein
VNVGVSSAAINVGSTNPGIVTVGVTGGTAWINGTVNIGATGGGNVAIGNNGATAGVCYVSSVGTNIASFNTDIGNLGNTAVVVNVGFNQAGGPIGTVNIGRGATAVTIGNTAAGFKSAGPITLGSAPSSYTQLGGLYTSSTFVGFSSPGNIYSFSLPIGNWLIVATLYFPGITTFATLSISSTSNAVDNYGAATSLGNGGIGLNVTRVVNLSAAQTWYIVANSNNAVTTQSAGLSVVRIG